MKQQITTGKKKWIIIISILVAILIGVLISTGVFTIWTVFAFITLAVMLYFLFRKNKYENTIKNKH